MNVLIRRRWLVALGILVLGAAPAWTQTIQITARTPSQGPTSGGTTVEVIGNGWFSPSGTSVTMLPAGAQPTNLVVHSSTRLTFVTPARPAGTATIVVASTAGSLSRPFTYVARAARALASARRPAFSYSGQYVAFESRYALAPDDTNGVTDIYVRHRATGAVRRVSIASSGAQALGGESTHAAISATGRFVAFQSRASNLVPGDTNGLADVFLHDRDADGNGTFDLVGASDRVSTLRVSISSPGRATPAVQAVGGDSGDPAISGNGRFVSFASAATNLVSGDTNARLDVFVHDRLSRETRRVSTNGNLAQGDDHSRNPAMSLTGRFVAFESLANNLAGGNPTRFDVFLHDRDVDEDGVMDEAGAIDTVLVSANLCAANLTNHSIDPSVTADGRFVVFTTVASNAVVDGNCQPTIDRNGVSDVFIYDRNTRSVVRRLNRTPQGREYQGASFTPVISANGQTLVFTTFDNGQDGAGASAGLQGVFAAAETGKSAPGTIPSPTDGNPPPPAVDPPAPTNSASDPAVSGDGTNSGHTIQPDPGTGEGEPGIEIGEVEGDADGTPFIAGISPASGPPAGGNIVEIQGANFVLGQATVLWNGVSRPVLAGSTTSTLRVAAAPGVAGTTATVRVIVTGESSNQIDYAYVAGLTAPVITSFDPATDSVAGGALVTITGSGFSGPTVRFGPQTGVVTASSAVSITVRVPVAAVAGPVPLVVENSDGATAVSSSPFTFTFVAPVSAPTVQTLAPVNGPVTGGTAITISGSQFAPGATVTVGGVAAATVQVLSNTQIVAVTPAGVEGPAQVVVTINGVASSTQTFEYLPLEPPVLTCGGSDTDLDGAPDLWEIQYGLSPTDGTDGALDPDSDGRTSAQECQDLTHPRGLYTRYLAEGATGSFFDTRVALANPGVTPARVLFRFQTRTGQTVRHFLTIPASSRRTLDLRLFSGLEAVDVSSVIESDTQIVVDRTMRWDQATRGGAHAESSVPSPSLQWYLAEGATHGFFDLFYLLQNPSQTTTAQVRIRYLLTSGAPIEQLVDVQPNSRSTISVDQQPGLAAVDVSAVVESLNGVPIIVERAMYSSAAGTFAAGHDSAGVTAPSTTWFFAEGATGAFFDYFLLFANPGGTAANVDVRYLRPTGAPIVRTHTIPANSRRTFYVAAEAPELVDTAVSVAVSSTNGVPIIAERSMWWPSGRPWIEAHNSAGSTTTGTKWGIGDGEVGTLPEDTATYILVANTSATAGTVRVTLLFETGAPVTKEFTVAANSRFNVPVVSSEFPESPGYLRVPRGTRFSATVESIGVVPAQIVVERAMYWNAAGVLWAAGSNLLATKLQ